MYLQGLNYVVGEAKPIETIESATEDKIKMLRAAGVTTYCQAVEDAFQNALAVGKEALSQTSLAASDIDMVIYGIEPIVNPSNNWVNTYSNDNRDIKWLFKNLELTTALPIGLGFFNCTSFVTAIDMAEKYIETGAAKNVLVIFSALSTEEGMLPRLPNDNSVESDGAAAFVLSTTKRGGANIKITQHSLQSIDLSAAFDESNEFVFNKYAAVKSGKIRKHCNEFLEEAGADKKSMKRFIIQNTNKPTMNLYRMLCGFDQEQLFESNLPKYGHLIGIDNLVNISDLLEDKTLEEGDQAYVLCTSGMQIGSLLIAVESVNQNQN
jgi:3-oxoacyl-[acyl-carrier-protein] synthase III